AYNSANYHEAVSQTFAAVVKRIGTGPWGGGLWQGDCQQYFLAVWLATSMLPAMELDYYIYDHFCENAGHQCFVLEKGLCEKCIQLSGMSAVIDASRCGDAGAAEMVQRMNGRQAGGHQPVVSLCCPALMEVCTATASPVTHAGAGHLLPAAGYRATAHPGELRHTCNSSLGFQGQHSPEQSYQRERGNPDPRASCFRGA
ncbi:unnamed protein product, partial [Symbiodinium microadriaticum]